MQGNPIPTPEQIGAQPVDADLTAIAALTTTVFGRSLLTQADAAATRSAIGISGVAWTPTIIGGTTTGAGTYTSQLGYLFQIGTLYAVFFRVVWTAHTGTGAMRISNLPFVISSQIERRGSVVFFEQNLTLPANTMLVGRGFASTAQILLGTTPIGGGASSTINVTGTGTIEGMLLTNV